LVYALAAKAALSLNFAQRDDDMRLPVPPPPPPPTVIHSQWIGR
jgi:hypothetical protein